MSPFNQSGYNISNYFFRFCLLEEILILLAILVIINCLIVVSPYTLSSEWIVITNARVLHNAYKKLITIILSRCSKSGHVLLNLGIF